MELELDRKPKQLGLASVVEVTATF